MGQIVNLYLINFLFPPLVSGFLFFVPFFWFVYPWIYMGVGECLFTLLKFVRFFPTESIFRVRPSLMAMVKLFEDAGLKSGLNEHCHCAKGLPWYFPRTPKIRILCHQVMQWESMGPTPQKLMDETVFCCSPAFPMGGLLPLPTFSLYKPSQDIFGF